MTLILHIRAFKFLKCLMRTEGWTALRLTGHTDVERDGMKYRLIYIKSLQK